MLVNLVAFTLVLNYFEIFTYGYLKAGLILKKGDESPSVIIEHILSNNGDLQGNSPVRIIKEIAEEEDARSYHRAFCRLLTSGIDVLISPTASPYSSILIAYAHEYQIPLITPELPETESELSREANSFSFGIGQSTARAMLHLFQLYGWKDVIYLYDHESGPENLHHIYLLGHRVLNLTLNGILKVSSTEEANNYLLKLDRSFKNKRFHVVLDIETNKAKDIIWRHVNDIHVRKKNFHFLLSKPTTEAFWESQKTAFGSVNVTTFLIKNQLTGQENFNVMQQLASNLEEENLEISSYYYYDAAVVLRRIARKFPGGNVPTHPAVNTSMRTGIPINCLEILPIPRPNGVVLSKLIKETSINGITGLIQFENGQRIGLDLNISEVTLNGFNRIGFWSNGILYPVASSSRNLPTSSPLVQNGHRLKIVSILSAPFMMLKTEENATSLQGNDRFEGYCKDLIDLLAKEMHFEYEIRLVEDNMFGIYDKSSRTWSGIIGEIIRGRADLAVSNLKINGQRQRVVDFTDPYEMVGFSLVMKNPRSISKLSSMIFFLSPFTADVWICIIFAVILFCTLFHFITQFTGAPDSIESASGIWGRKHTFVLNLWFAVGSSLLRGTGVYPRSISSRILSGFFWFFTLILSSLFIASVTAQILTGLQMDDDNPQLSQLKALSLETIIAESIKRGWPKIGLIQGSNAEKFIRRSKLPTYVAYADYLNQNPGVIVSAAQDGIDRVKRSAGGYMLLLETLDSEYAIRRKPCDIIAIHDSIPYAGYGIATPLGSLLTQNINDALYTIQKEGALSELHRKWLIESSECQNKFEHSKNDRTVHVFSGLLCVSAVGFLIVSCVFAIQYIRRNQNKETRRQQLSFEDMNLGQPLPTPPPELLAEPPPVLNLPEYDKRTLL